MAGRDPALTRRCARRLWLNENKDGDHYFCTPGTADLEPVFRQVAAAAIETAHLIDASALVLVLNLMLSRPGRTVCRHAPTKREALTTWSAAIARSVV